MTTARAPGKLILAGEHAVVLGCPAIAMAINKFTDTIISEEKSTPTTALFNLLDLKERSRHPLAQLKKIKQRLKAKYRAFEAGELHVRDIIKKPIELAEYVAAQFIQQQNINVQSSLKIDTRSTIPLGCGMGSSAAAIVSGNLALDEFFKQNIGHKNHIEMCLAAENLQHGKSSGLDIQVATHGGCLYFSDGETTPLPAPTFPLQLLNTGKPVSSTGECVAHTRPLLTEARLQAFRESVTQMRAGLTDLAQFINAVKLNHRLLCELGVVPEYIQSKVAEIEAKGGAAKICGAGTLRGDNAGALLIISNDTHGEQIHCCQQGAHVVD